MYVCIVTVLRRRAARRSGCAKFRRTAPGEADPGFRVLTHRLWGLRIQRDEFCLVFLRHRVFGLSDSLEVYARVRLGVSGEQGLGTWAFLGHGLPGNAE